MLLIADYVLPVTSDPIEKGAVLVKDDRIVDIGPADLLRQRYADEEVRDFGQAAITPGFVDLHTHLEGAALRGIVHDVPYATWLLTVSQKTQMMTSSDSIDSATLGALEALSSGITCLSDIAPDAGAVTALSRLGMRGVIYREVGAMDKRRVDYAMERAMTDISEWQSKVDSSLITVGVAPMPLYTCHPSIFRSISDFAGDKLPIAMHIAGSKEEYDFIKYGSNAFAVDTMDDARGFVEVPPWLPTGATPVNYALNWGAFDAENVMAVHCVHVDHDDIMKLKQHNVSIAVCPRTNAQLGMGVAPLTEFLRNGLTVGLGTDSPAAVDSTDMLIEMRNSMLVQRATHPGQFLPASTMLKMATIDGARALRMDDKIGSLEIGKLADIVAIDMSGSHQTPTNDPVSAVVNTTNGSDILMTMVGGVVKFEKNQWHVDVEVAKSIAHVIKIRSKLRA